jgi:DNA-binding transcriptional LysR family regulator
MNFAQLRFVKATNKLRSFSQAALLCNVTQPTLSNGINKLESELNNKIFDRTTRSVSLTKFGEAILDDLEQLLDLQKSIYKRAEQKIQTSQHTLKIGVSPLISGDYIQKLIFKFRKSNPEINFVFEEKNLTQLQENLAMQSLDLILVPKMSELEDTRSMPLYCDELYYISAAKTNQQNIELGCIRQETFVMVPNDCGLAKITRNLVRTSRYEILEYSGQASNYQMLIDWAMSGLGSAILPKSKIYSQINARRLTRANMAATIQFEAQWGADNFAPLNTVLDQIGQVSA